VTSTFIEFESTAPLPNQTVTPGVGSLVIFDQAKRWIYVEVNQEVELMLNGHRLPPIVPFLAGDDGKIGPFMHSGIIYSMALANKSTQEARVRIISVE
jgi:hypothetical protein